MGDDRRGRDIRAPQHAVAWASGLRATPGRWLYDDADVVRAERSGEVVWRTEVDPASGQAWLRNVRGAASSADVIDVVTELDQLRGVLITLAEDAVDALSARRA